MRIVIKNVVTEVKSEMLDGVHRGIHSFDIEEADQTFNLGIDNALSTIFYALVVTTMAAAK